MSEAPEWWKKPSLALGLKKDGTIEVVRLDDAAETLADFRARVAEGKDSQYVEVKWFRKMRHDKHRVIQGAPKVSVTKDISQWDGRPIGDPDSAETAAAEVIADEPKEPAPPKRGRPPKNK